MHLFLTIYKNDEQKTVKFWENVKKTQPYLSHLGKSKMDTFGFVWKKPGLNFDFVCDGKHRGC